ncbi:MAG: hypothetical protein Q9163_002065 [Psora crenata]
MDDPLEPSPYKTLNVPKDATLPTIRSAHRKLVLSCHPDKVQDESAKKIKAEQFHQVQQAYEILSDENRRRRWDERAKLAGLRAEMMMDEKGPPRKADYGSSRTASSPVVEVRDGRLYEERVPKGSRAYEEDVFASRFADARASSRKYDDRHTNPPLRKSSGRTHEDKRRSTEADIRYEKKMNEKREREAEAAARDERTRKRDKDKRKDTEAKFKSKAAYVEEFTTDSEDNERYTTSKNEGSRPKRKEDPRKRSREEPLRRSSKKERDYDDELDRKIYGVHDYMNKSREAVEVEPRRAGRSRATSNLDRRPPPPPSPHNVPLDSGRRSSGDDARRPSGRGRNGRAVSPVRKSGRDKRVTEIVDPPSSRKPSIPGASSDPRGLKNIFSSSSKSKAEPQRSATYTPAKEMKQPGIRRAETLPVNQMRRGDPVHTKSSHLKTAKATSDVSDSSETSDSDSDATPVMHPRSTPRQPATKYKIHEDDEDQGRRSYFVDVGEKYTRPRENSPKSHRRSSDRPPMAGHRSPNARSPMTRAATTVFPPDERPSPRHTFSRTESARLPPLKTHTSSRGNGQLFGEFSEEYSPKSYDTSPKTYVDEVRHTKPYYNRRGSEDVDRDAYPGSHRRPHHNRSEVYV